MLNQATSSMLAGIQKFSAPFALIYSVYCHMVQARHGDGEVVSVPSAHRPLSLFALQPQAKTSVVAGQNVPLCSALCWLPHCTSHTIRPNCEVCSYCWTRVWSLTSSHLVDILKVFSREPDVT